MNKYKITYGPGDNDFYLCRAKNKGKALEKFFAHVDSIMDETEEDLEWMTECVVVNGVP